MKEVIIAEKEEAAREIAEILWHIFETEEQNGIRYFRHESSVVVPARGHLLNPKIKGVTSAQNGTNKKYTSKYRSQFHRF